MVNEEFYAVNGDKVTPSTLVQRMIDYFNEKYPDVQITDFNDGSVIRNLLESFSRDIYHLEFNNNLLLRQAFITTATGDYLDLYGQEYGITRKNPKKSQGTVTFSISEPVNYLINIPQYTRIVDTATGLYYETWTSVEIPIGETSVDCPVYSVVTGSGTNILAGSEFLFYDENQFREVSIVNDADFTGGCDAESDNDYRARLIEAKTSDGFGSREYYVKLGRIDGVHDIALVDSESHTAKVIVNGFDKPITDNLLSLVTANYTNEKNLVYNHSFEVEKATFTDVDLIIEMIVSDEIQDSIIESILNNYFDGGILNINNQLFNNRGCSVNSKITNYELMAFLESIDGVMEVTSIYCPLGFPLVPMTDKVLRLGSLTVVQEIVE